MHKLHELKEMLCDELEEYGSKGKLDVGALDIVDKLAHAIKNIDKIIEQEDYSERSYRGRSYRGSYRDTYRDSYGDSYGSYRRRRDSMGRYARNDMVDELRNLADSAPDQRTREKIERFIEEME